MSYPDERSILSAELPQHIVIKNIFRKLQKILFILLLDNMHYDIVIGLEIHIKLNSSTKLFCGCKNEQEFDELSANTNICPVCTGQPGALPVLQPEPLYKAMLLGHVLHCDRQEGCFFDRKSYLYPDLPLGYQITQHNRPLNVNGYVDFWNSDFTHKQRIRIHQAHLESDAGKMTHENNKAYIDYNRAGTPLVEIVTEPDFRSADDVVNFLKELQLIVRYNNIGYADLEKGQMRCDVNVSIKPSGTETLGTKVEIKNMNSLSAIKKAIEYEAGRHEQVLDDNGMLDQETRGRDEATGTSFVMRSKENALDYRYFPEPDLPPVQLPTHMKDEIADHELIIPAEQIDIYLSSYGFHKEYIYGLIQNKEIYDTFHQAIRDNITPKIAAKRLTGEVARYMTPDNPTFAHLGRTLTALIDFLGRIDSGDLIDAHAKKALRLMVETDDSLDTIITQYELYPVSDDFITEIVDKVIAANPQAIEDYRNGEKKSLGFLIGQAMQSSQGKGDPKNIREILIKRLDA